MKKTHLLILSTTAVLAMAAALIPNISKVAFGEADYSNGTWVHYAQKDATKEEKGIREYWIMCGSGTHQFTAPDGVTPVEATTYDTTGFRDDDDRWIYPVTIDAQDVVMTDTTKALSLGDYTGMSVSSITAGTLSLGSDASNLDVSGFAADHSDDGLKTVTVYGVKDDKAYAVFTDTTFVTATISTADEWKANVVPAASGTTIYGYYKLTADFTISTYPAWISGWDKAVFSGTIDGANHKLTVGQGTYGQFYLTNNATLKNMTIHNNWWRRATVNYCSIANKSINSHYENLTFDQPVVGSGATDAYTPATNYGYLFGNGGAQGNSFKNCSWDFGTYDLPCLLSHSNNNTATNTFEGCTLKCGSYTEIYSTSAGSITSADGLTITLNNPTVLDITPIEIDTTADSVSVTLPDTYSGCTVEDIYFSVDGTDTSVGTDLTNIVLPSALASDPAAHGNQSMYVKINNNGVSQTLSVPVLLVTKTVTTNDELLAIVNPSAVTTTYGYYKLGANLNINSNWTEKTSSTISVFAGTFDGCGYTITSKSRVGGVFGDLNGATIKNLTITDGWCYGGVDMAQALLSRDMKTSTITDCTFKVTAKASRTLNTSLAISAQNYGWINCRICQSCSFTNCTFDAKTVATPIQTLLGTHASCVNNTFANSTFSCDSYYCLFQSSYTNLVTVDADGLTISGTCVYNPAE